MLWWLVLVVVVVLVVLLLVFVVFVLVVLVMVVVVMVVVARARRKTRRKTRICLRKMSSVTRFVQVVHAKIEFLYIYIPLVALLYWMQY